MKLWNKNYFLLWQGQTVSVLGDALYATALGFWVIQETGSTLLMGTLMALMNIPMIIIGPFAGIIVDRYDRKKLIVLSDLICGAGILFIAIAGFMDVLDVWMIMFVGILSGICSAFFNPSIQSVLPDIVPETQLIKASSTFQVATNGANIVGSSIGGFLYALLGAPLLFLFNGISFIFSGVSELFMDIPKSEVRGEKLTFKQDFLDGLSFIYKHQGLVKTIIAAIFINFLYAMIHVLLIPWFLNEPQLGMEPYGLLGGAMSLGVIGGSLILSVFTINPEHKYRVYVSTILGFMVLVLLAAFSNQVVLILLLFMVAFAGQSIFNTIANSTIMLVTPQTMRGKVFSTISTIAMCVSPLGSFIGGAMGEFYSPRLIIMINCLLGFIITAVIISHKSVREFLNIES